MSGTVAGGKKAYATNTAKYGSDFYKRIGAIGGKNGKTGGFYHMKATGRLELVRAYGRQGGSMSRRRKNNE